MRKPLSWYQPEVLPMSKVEEKDSSFARFVRSLWPKERSVIGATIYPLTTRTTRISNGDLMFTNVGKS